MNTDFKMSRVYQYAEYALHSSFPASCAYGVIRTAFRAATVVLGLLPAAKTDPSQADRRSLEAIYPFPQKRECVYTNKSDMCDLTVIVPVFNSEKTVEKCLLSVLEQETAFSYELIAVDDGSTDGTRRLLEDLSARYPKLKLVEKSNGGASSARNCGLNEAAGRYVMFVDADDVLRPGAMEKLMKKASECDADLVQGSWEYRGGSIQRYPDCTCTKTQLALLMGVPWGKVMKRSLFYDVRFPEEFTSYVDTPIKWLIYTRCKKAFLISDCVYSWTRNESGITSTSKNSARAMQAYWIFEYYIDQYLNYPLPLGEQFDQIFMKQSSVTVGRVSCFDENVRRTIFDLLCRHLDIIGSEKLPFPYSMLRRAMRRGDFRSYCFIGSHWDYLL